VGKGLAIRQTVIADKGLGKIILVVAYLTHLLMTVKNSVNVPRDMWHKILEPVPAVL
jgi:hypothetical protein